MFTTMEEVLKTIETRVKRIASDTELQTQKYHFNEDEQEPECPICNDLEWIVVEEGAYPCKCQAIKNYKRRLRRCNLENVIDSFTLDNFNGDTEERTKAKAIAERYVKAERYISNGADPSNLLFLGQSGSGKTHLALAIAREILKQGIDVYYMQYRDYMTEAKSKMFDSYEYEKLLKQAKQAPVLVIDDLYKGRVSNGDVSNAEVNIMYEIVNYRTLKKLATIVTSEMDYNQIIKVDEAIGSRLYFKGKDAKITMPQINYRTKGGN